MPMFLIEDFSEWSARHGGEPVRVGGRLLFADGAMSDADTGTQRWEPPAETSELLKQQRRYFEAKLAAAENRFSQTRSELSEQCALAMTYSNLPGPPPDAEEMLLGLKAVVHELRAEKERIDKLLAKMPEAMANRSQAEQLMKRRQQISRLRSDIHAIRLDN